MTDEAKRETATVEIPAWAPWAFLALAIGLAAVAFARARKSRAVGPSAPAGELDELTTAGPKIAPLVEPIGEAASAPAATEAGTT